MRFSKPALVLACVLLAGCGVQDRPAPDLSALEQTVLKVPPGAPLHLPAMLGTDGKLVSPAALQGRWSVIFLGFTWCPDVCPTTLHVLSSVARDPASGVGSGNTQIVFVSVDPERDTPERLRDYLGYFGGVTGLTGSPEAVSQFVSELGGAYQASESGIDHSTSLFVLDPQGRLAGVLLRPADPSRIAADLAALRASGS